MAIKALAIAALLMSAACNYSEKKDAVGTQTVPTTETPAGSTSFAALQRDLFNPFCVSCHNSTRQQGGVALDTYAGVVARVTPGNGAGSLIHTEIAGSQMPPGGNATAAAQLPSLKAWIDAGADEQAFVKLPLTSPVPSPQPAPDTPQKVNFTGLVSSIFATKCLPCHAPKADGRGPAAGIPLHDYDALMAANGDSGILKPGDPDASALLESIETGRMPKRADKLSDDDIALVRSWIAEGASK